MAVDTVLMDTPGETRMRGALALVWLNLGWAATALGLTLLGMGLQSLHYSASLTDFLRDDPSEETHLNWIASSGLGLTIAGLVVAALAFAFFTVCAAQSSRR